MLQFAVASTTAAPPPHPHALLEAGPLVGADVADGFWYKWLSSEGRRYGVHDDYLQRTAPNATLPAFLCARLPTTAAPVRVLDVGAGPLSSVGTDCGPDRPLTLISTDVLAPQYDATLARVGLEPRVRTQYCPAEAIARCFAPDYFDMVTSFNALDHAQAPVDGIEQMLTVLKPGGSMVLLHHANESAQQGGAGMHRWDFYPDPASRRGMESANVFVAGGAHTESAGQRVDLAARLRGRATVATHAPWSSRAAGRNDPRAFVVEIVKAAAS